jgi:hypothetical protein
LHNDADIDLDRHLRPAARYSHDLSSDARAPAVKIETTRPGRRFTRRIGGLLYHYAGSQRSGEERTTVGLHQYLTLE